MTLRTPTPTEITTRNCVPGCTRCAAETRTAPTAPLKVRLSVRRFEGAWRLEVIADGSALMGYGRWDSLWSALVAKWRLGRLSHGELIGVLGAGQIFKGQA